MGGLSALQRSLRRRLAACAREPNRAFVTDRDRARQYRVGETAHIGGTTHTLTAACRRRRFFHGEEGESEYDGETALRALHDATHAEQEEE